MWAVRVAKRKKQLHVLGAVAFWGANRGFTPAG
jgi:hypothetical protein